MLNPFLYGKPVPPSQHVGRKIEIRTLFSRLANGESTAIVGEPHIGKSSLMQYIADENNRFAWLGEDATQYSFVDFDCHMLAADCAPTIFWHQVLTRIREMDTQYGLQQQCDLAVQNGFSSFTLEGLFKLLAKQQRRVILVIDEFDTLLHHPKFNNTQFFGALRSLATRTDALVVITASRLSVAQMNRKSQEINPYGSPFFNNPLC
jgi:Cdc6-like AAA superfamily ATPase